jgi:zinc protease
MGESIYITGPAKQPFSVPAFSAPEHFTLDNGVEVYAVLSDQTETLKIEWIFEAGSTAAQKVLQATACADLLNKGTHTKSGFDINEQLDLYGSYFSADSSRDDITLQLFTLRRFLPQVLPIIADLLKEAAYPENEFDVWLDAKKSIYEVNQNKTDFMAATRFPSVIFGNNTPYGFFLKKEHFSQLYVEDARAHHQCLLQSPFKIFVSGSVPPNWRMLLHNCFSDLRPSENITKNAFDENVSTDDRLFVEVSDSVQNSIIVGKRLIVRDVEKYTPFMVMNTMLGGYFGSRLMANLREKNGFTYGAGSGLSRMKFSDVYKISTDVGAEVSDDAQREILHEIKVLQTDLAKDEELQRVKTYMSGSFLRSFDGPQAIMDRYKSLILYGMPMDFFKSYAEGIQSVTAEDVRTCAQDYLKELKTVVSGKEDTSR